MRLGWRTPMTDTWAKNREWMIDAFQIFAIIVVLVSLVVMLSWGAIRYGNNNEEEFRKTCEDKLRSEFVTEPEWMCVRDGNITYKPSSD